MIRPAVASDIPAIVGMASEFYATTPYPALAPMDAESVERLCVGMMEGHGVLLVVDEGGPVGMACAVFAPFLFNQSLKMASELVWWLNPEARGAGTALRLLAALEQACKDAGCDFLQMVKLSTSPEHVDRLYVRAGYVRNETAYWKGL